MLSPIEWNWGPKTGEPLTRLPVGDSDVSAVGSCTEGDRN